MKCRYVYEDKYRYAKYYFKIINTLENIQMFKRMTGRKRYLNVDEVKRKTFKKSTITFDNFMHHLLLILFYFYFPFLRFPFLNCLTQFFLDIFLLSLNGDFIYRFTRDGLFRRLIPTIFLTS